MEKKGFISRHTHDMLRGQRSNKFISKGEPTRGSEVRFGKTLNVLR